jgi:hypothetical protein
MLAYELHKLRRLPAASIDIKIVVGKDVVTMLSGFLGALH